MVAKKQDSFDRVTNKKIKDTEITVYISNEIQRKIDELSSMDKRAEEVQKKAEQVIENNKRLILLL